MLLADEIAADKQEDVVLNCFHQRFITASIHSDTVAGCNLLINSDKGGGGGAKVIDPNYRYR